MIYLNRKVFNKMRTYSIETNDFRILPDSYGSTKIIRLEIQKMINMI